ncbi:hypothetical protein CSKR_200396 [Clonorchis sinensis]|uniref:Uncharacterized protein n=2 Tax=Clonorchis sinensis TaxID=79923 RepID=A0A8T1MDN4_CLOSI|nr:hypothetical protein CSKR_200396 [Clonorchis sinensis]GAA55726.1 hypothetical protein CLF_108846 [Clonorchis sinensis]
MKEALFMKLSSLTLGRVRSLEFPKYCKNQQDKELISDHRTTVHQGEAPTRTVQCFRIVQKKIFPNLLFLLSFPNGKHRGSSPF